MNDPIAKQIYAQALGSLLLSYLDAQGCPPLPDTVETRALAAISNIKAILDDEALNDADCCQRIEAIVREFHANGLDTSRHDWG